MIVLLCTTTTLVINTSLAVVRPVFGACVLMRTAVSSFRNGAPKEGGLTVCHFFVTCLVFCVVVDHLEQFSRMSSSSASLPPCFESGAQLWQFQREDRRESGLLVLIAICAALAGTALLVLLSACRLTYKWRQRALHRALIDRITEPMFNAPSTYDATHRRY